MLEIIALSAFADNYIWVGVNQQLKQAFIVDPGDARPVISFLQQHQLTPEAILLTHKHADHTGGVSQLVRAYPNISVYAHPQEELSLVTHPVQDGEEFTLNMWTEKFQVIHIPGHTLGHIAFYTKPNLFCGDTLFSAGCGRVFEGTAEQMLASLNKLASLPAETFIFCGHEYTLSNLRFASLVEPANTHIKDYVIEIKQKREQGLTSLPSTMKIEKQINPFLRCDEEGVISAATKSAGKPLSDAAAVFHQIREWKNNF